MKKYKIAVVDGKGGGLGKAFVDALCRLKREDIRIIALGTNSLATAAMLEAGADDGATGENAICHMAERVDVIMGPMAILVANSMLGEITPAMASAIAESEAEKILLPMQRCGVQVLGTKDCSAREMLSEIGKALDRALAAADA